VKKIRCPARSLTGKAGVKEYWLVDARKEPVKFGSFRHTETGYTRHRRQRVADARRSSASHFRITRSIASFNKPAFTLEALMGETICVACVTA